MQDDILQEFRATELGLDSLRGRMHSVHLTAVSRVSSFRFKHWDENFTTTSSVSLPSQHPECVFSLERVLVKQGVYILYITGALKPHVTVK